MADRIQSPGEEKANVITHAIGVAFAVCAMPFLIHYAYTNGSSSMLWSVCVFGFGMLMVYLSSTCYHAAKNIKTKKALQVWDHVSIFLMIAGSYTPFVVKFIEPGTALIFLSIMWGLVAFGSFLKLFYTGRFKVISVLVYLALGWMAVFILQPLIKNLPVQIWYWIIASGLSYTLGVTFYLWHRLQFHHAIWHVFVLGGTVTHFVAICKSVEVAVHF